MSTSAREPADRSNRQLDAGRGSSGRTLADRVRRRRLAALAGHEHDVDTARALFADDDPGVRATALQALARCDELSDDTLAAAARDGSPIVRRRVAELLATRAGGVPLLPLLDDVDPGVTETAAWAAGERFEPGRSAGGADVRSEIVGRLATLARRHDDPLVREAAVAALGSMGDPEGLPAILDALGDKVTIRRRAVIALAPFEGDEVDRALADALDDRDWHVRQTAEDLLE